MRLLILGSTLAILTAACAAQDKPPRVKHFAGRPESKKSVVIGKTPSSASAETNLRRLEQQANKLSAPPRIKRTPRTATLLKPEREKSAARIEFSKASNGAKGPGTTKQGTNPYAGRLRQKGSHH